MKKYSYTGVLKYTGAGILLGFMFVLNAYLLNRMLKRNSRLSAQLLIGHISSLSPRELEVLELIGKGSTTKEIASDLSLSPRTVDIHRANIKKKLALKSSAEVVAFAIART